MKSAVWKWVAVAVLILALATLRQLAGRNGQASQGGCGCGSGVCPTAPPK